MNGDDRAKTHNTPKVEISVRNFGPIAEADLDLRPLTVFVGPSNTGKTYLSVLIYALHRAFGEFSGFPLIDHVDMSLKVHASILGLPVNFDKLADEIQDPHSKQNLKKSKFKFSNLPERVRNLAQSGLTDPDFFCTELKRCFDIDAISELIYLTSGSHSEMAISLKVSRADQNLWNFDMRSSESETTTDGRISEEMVLFPIDGKRFKEPISPEDCLELLSWFSTLTRRRYYLPAARSGSMQSHRVIASSLVARSTRTGLETSEIPTLSGVVADFMEQLILYKEDARPDDGMNRIVDALESDVLDGQIIMKPSPTGYPEFLYRPQGTEQDMRLTRSSSMVSELAPLVLFIRGLVRPGDMLIIEEPEAHLHPAAQAQMAATLARLVRAGVRVLVTTHSDFMLQEIGNLIREGELGEQTGEPASWLKQEEIGAWLFQKNGTVKEIEFDRIKGIEPMEYEDVAEALYNRWADLQYQLDKKTGDEEDKV